MHAFKKIGLGVLALALTSPAIAADRLAESQGSYLGSVVEILILVVTSIMFLASLAVLLIAGWFLIRDYVMKDDREKRFTFPQLLVAMIVAGILGYPSGAYILGQDLLTGNEGGAQIRQQDFQRSGN